jgi:hypothetical protein
LLSALDEKQLVDELMKSDRNIFTFGRSLPSTPYALLRENKTLRLLVCDTLREPSVAMTEIRSPCVSPV